MPSPFVKGNKLSTGRPVGSANKRRSIEELCLEMGVDPFKTLCEFLQERVDADGEKIETNPGLKLMAAKELCKYLEPQKKAIEVTKAIDSKIVEEMQAIADMSKDQLLQTVQAELKRIEKK